MTLQRRLFLYRHTSGWLKRHFTNHQTVAWQLITDHDILAQEVHATDIAPLHIINREKAFSRTNQRVLDIIIDYALAMSLDDAIMIWDRYGNWRPQVPELPVLGFQNDYDGRFRLGVTLMVFHAMQDVLGVYQETAPIPIGGRLTKV